MGGEVSREEYQQTIDKLHERIDKISESNIRIETSNKSIETMVVSIKKSVDSLYCVLHGNGKEGLVTKVSNLGRDFKVQWNILLLVLVGLLGIVWKTLGG